MKWWWNSQRQWTTITDLSWLVSDWWVHLLSPSHVTGHVTPASQWQATRELGAANHNATQCFVRQLLQIWLRSRRDPLLSLNICQENWITMAPSIGLNLRVTGYKHQGGRKYMEDEFGVAYQQTADEKDLEYAFFGIFDGHGGREAALFAKVSFSFLPLISFSEVESWNSFISIGRTKINIENLIWKKLAF